VRGGAASDEPFPGSPDISTLADMGGSYTVIEDMRTVPVAPKLLIPLVLALVLPLLPLALTMVPLESLVEVLISLMF
jgi:hypothetical protein